MCTLYSTVIHVYACETLHTPLYPQNYRHCFQEAEGSSDTTPGHGQEVPVTPYQILNSTGVSSLRWHGHNGIYVMVATVVARNYRLVGMEASTSKV